MQKTDFNRDWTVQKDGSTEILHVNLPDDAMIREERSKENKTASASAYFAGGKYIYTKIFDLSENETRQTLILEFEAVYQNATVFLNGRQVAEHPYGYTNFFVDITGKVIAGTNELKVVADNADVPNSRWYSGSGIYREVHLYRSESSYIRPEGLKVQIVDLNTIHIFADAVMQPNEKIVLEIFSDSGKIASAEGTDVTITIPDAHLWSSEDPYLYTCQATLLQGGTVIDTAKSSFGIRTLSWGKDGFLVNNNPVLFRGACIHHDNGVLGACGFHDAEFRRVRILKEVGWSKIIWGLQKAPTIGVDPYTRADYFQSLSMWRITDAVESWSWEGCEGKKASVTVYSDAAKVELFVNGKSAGKKKTKKDIAKFKKIPYEAGKIEAVTYDSSGKETGRTSLISATGKTLIKLTPEATSLCANGQDLCFLNIDLIGENGITKSSVDQNLKIEISGPATLQGYGSARPNIEKSFCSDTFKTFYGKSLAVIRAGYEPGTVTVKVSGKGLDTQKLTLNIC